MKKFLLVFFLGIGMHFCYAQQSGTPAGTAMPQTQAWVNGTGTTGTLSLYFGSSQYFQVPTYKQFLDSLLQAIKYADTTSKIETRYHALHTYQPLLTGLTFGTIGTDFNGGISGGSLALNIPDASATARGLVTITNQTLGVAGTTKTFAGNVTINQLLSLANTLQSNTGGAAASNLYLLSSAVSNITTAKYLFGGTTGVYYRMLFNGANSGNLTGANNYASSIWADHTVPVVTAITIPVASQLVVKNFTLSLAGTAAVTEKDGLYLEAQKGGVTNYSMHALGKVKIDQHDTGVAGTDSLLVSTGGEVKAIPANYYAASANTISSVAFGTTGTDPAGSIAGGVLTINLPTMVATGANFGLLNNTTQTIPGTKTFGNGLISTGPTILGNTNFASANLYVAQTYSTATLAKFLFGGATTSVARTWVGGGTSAQIGVSSNYAGTLLADNPVSVATAITVPVASQLVVKNFTPTLAGTGAITEKDGLYLENQTGGVNNYSLHALGKVKIDQHAAGVAGTDSILVSNAGEVKAIPANYYAPATAAVSSVALGTTGTDPNANITNSLLTINLPTMAATGINVGLLNNTTQTIPGTKTFGNGLISAGPAILGNTNSASANLYVAQTYSTATLAKFLFGGATTSVARTWVGGGNNAVIGAASNYAGTLLADNPISVATGITVPIASQLVVKNFTPALTGTGAITEKDGLYLESQTGGVANYSLRALGKVKIDQHATGTAGTDSLLVTKGGEVMAIAANSYLAASTGVLHTTGNETKTGVLTFKSPSTVYDGSPTVAALPIMSFYNSIGELVMDYRFTTNMLALGTGAGAYETTGTNNTFLGNNAGNHNTTGSQNSFFGSNVGNNNTTGFANSFFGVATGNGNTIGSSNSFFGTQVGSNNTTGSVNNFMGYNAGVFNTTGNTNNFIGAYAGRSNTTGSSNTFVGTSAGYSNISGGTNSFFGASAGNANTIGGNNVFLGYLSGSLNSTGNFNIAIGNSAGANNQNIVTPSTITTGSNNIIIGNQANVPDGTQSNQLSIGNLIYGIGLAGTGPTISTGNIGIGVINPDAKLAVAGTVHAKEVKINLTGLPDYVFDDNYTLATLPQVKAYIDKNHHLSEIPSAQEVERDGMYLGEMNAKLLKKVEELTLYLIEKDDQMKKYQQQLAEIAKNSQNQDQRIKELEQLLLAVINNSKKDTKQ